MPSLPPVLLAMALGIAVAAIAMIRFRTSPGLALPLLAAFFLALQRENAVGILEHVAPTAAVVFVMFTAVALPAHQIDRSGAFASLGAIIGAAAGRQFLHRSDKAIVVVVLLMLLTTFVTASLLHNMTSILVTAPLAMALCSIYRIPSRWILSGQLVASNLGGFSTAWGDTPNIIEARVWGLTHADFAREILPVNLAILGLLVLVVAKLTRRATAGPPDPAAVAAAIADFDDRRRELYVDRRLLVIGSVLLLGVVVSGAVLPQYAVALAAAGVLVAVLAERREEREHTLHALGFETYLILGSVFVIAGCVEQSPLHTMLQDLLYRTAGAPWAIALAAFLGTSLTEAASWAAAAATATHQINPSRAAAWALGGGICAGSSALITAASAGIILSALTRRLHEGRHHVSFAAYACFGYPVAIGMMVLYAAAATFLL